MANVYISERDRAKEKVIAQKAAIANAKKTVPIRIMNGWVFVTPKQAKDKGYMEILRKRYNIEEIKNK